MKSPLLFIIVLILAATIGCRKPGREVILLKNNYNDTIVTLVAWPGIQPVYPDTLLSEVKPIFKNGVAPGEKRVIISTGMGGSWDGIINNLPADTLSIYLFDSKTLSTNDWSQIRDKYLILKRFDLSLQDLKDNNYTITYP